MSREHLLSPPVLLFSSSDWEGLWGSRQQVALELNRRGYRVLFIERFAGLEHLYKYPDMRRRRLSGRPPVVEQADGLWRAMPPPLLPGYYHSPTVTRINANVVDWRLKSAIEQFLQGERPILWLFKPEHHFMIGRYNELISVYHCIDEWTVGTSGRKKAVIEQLEKEMLHKADMVFANSVLTWQNKKKIAPHALRFPSGADIAHFQQSATAQPPAQLAALKSPILMFAGWIGDKINLNLLHQVAVEKPDCTLVIIGGLFPGHDTMSMKKLAQLPNVILPGRIAFDQLPNWFGGADLCLLPYVTGDQAKYRSPLKLYEYLATGLPVVSTPHPEVNAFEAHVAIAEPAAWTATIDAVLQQDTAEKRQTRLLLAKENSWEVRVTGMLNAVQNYLGVQI